MSRLGKMPVQLPSGVTAAIAGNLVTISGPKGKIARNFAEGITVKQEDGRLVLSRASDEKRHKSLHGLSRTLLVNMVKGVVEGYKKELEINGVGYKAELKGKSVILALGYSHPVDFPIPDGIKIDIEKAVRLTITGIDKELVGNTAARLKSIKVPDPYKQKGIKYVGEILRKKAGKVIGAATTGGGGK